MNEETNERGECGPLGVDAYKLRERELEANLSSEGFMTRGKQPYMGIVGSVVFGSTISHGKLQCPLL